MGWRRVLALALVVLFLGMTVSGASAAASFVNATTNSTVTVPQGFNPEKKPGNDIQPQFIPAILAGISIVVGSTELLAITVSLATLMTMGLYKVIEKYGGKVADIILRATGFKQLSEFSDGFLNAAGYSMSHPNVEVHLKKLWFIPLPIAEKVVIKDGSETIVEVKKSELDQVNDLFTPKEFGQLLGQAYLNGWDANKAKEFTEELYKETRTLPKFNGRYTSCGYWPPGKVKLFESDLRHIIRRHYEGKVYYGEPDATVFPKSITGKWLADVIKKAITSGEVNCGKTNPNGGKIALEVNTEIGRVRVILQRIGYKSYKVLTVYLLKSH